MSTLNKIFKNAAKERAAKPKKDRGDLSKAFVFDCGGTLFVDGVLDESLFNWAVALKKGGHDVRLMSETPEVYKKLVKKRLKGLGLSENYLRDNHDITISNRENFKGRTVFALIDNDPPYLHGINAMVLLKTDDPDLIKTLEKHSKPKKKIPDDLRPKVLFV